KKIKKYQGDKSKQPPCFVLLMKTRRRLYVLMWKRRAVITSLCMTLVIGLVVAAVPTAHAAVGFSLYTPFSGISATPGETIDYAVEVLNDTDAIRTVEFKMQKLPDGWTSHLTSGGRDVQQLSIKPGD